MSNTNKITLTFLDRPYLSPGMPDLPVGPEDYHPDGIVSEVGKPTTSMTVWGPVCAFTLRAPMRYKVPAHTFGKGFLGDAFAGFAHTRLEISPSGATTKSKGTITAKMSAQQNTLIKMYQVWRGDAIFICRLDEPLGSSHLIEFYCPHNDDKSVTRGVRWKPTVNPVIALRVGFYEAMPFFPTSPTNPRNGLTLNYRVLEDNSIETVVRPIKVSFFTMVYNVSTAGFKFSNTFVDAVPFVPASKPKLSDDDSYSTVVKVSDLVEGRHQMDEASASADVASPIGDPVTDIQDNITAIETLPADKLPTKPPPLIKGHVASKDALASVNTKWLEWKTIEIKASKNDPLSFKITPYTMRAGRGENIFRPYRRNVWVMFPITDGQSRGMKLKLVSNRPPQIAGMIRVHQGNNVGLPMVFHKFGTTTELDLIPDFIYNQTVLRHYASPWVRTYDVVFNFQLEVVDFNRTGDIEELKIQMFLKAGNARFQVPMKPRAPPSNPTRDLHYFTRLTNETDITTEMLVSFAHSLKAELSRPTFEVVEDEVVARHQMNEIAPPAAQGEEEGEFLHSLGDDDPLEQDDFPLLIMQPKLTKDKILRIPLDLFKLNDLASGGGRSTLAERINRFGSMIPTGSCDYGPSCGTYSLVINTPTNVSGMIEHVAIPTDASLDVARINFDLSSILSMAGSALASVGGAVLNGAIDTVGSAVSGLASSIFGGGSSNAGQSISGPIPTSRYLSHIPTQDFQLTSPFSDLFLRATDLTGLQELPVNVFAHLKDLRWDRLLFDRDIVPQSSASYSLEVEPIESLMLIEEFVDSRKDFQIARAAKLTAFMGNYILRSSMSDKLDIGRLDELPVPSKADLLFAFRSVNIFRTSRIPSRAFPLSLGDEPPSPDSDS
uniref:Putative capsid n=1 Tax=Stamford virus TaxID=2600335 RepID=A0A5B8XAK5_9PICO|nr:putative capsid [Stamford virus]